MWRIIDCRRRAFSVPSVIYGNVRESFKHSAKIGNLDWESVVSIILYYTIQCLIFSQRTDAMRKTIKYKYD